jgi:DNA-binding MarR family transcriptional regulator
VSDTAEDRGHGTGHQGDPQAVPERLRTMRTRLLSFAAMYSDRMVTSELARIGARKWHYAVLVSLHDNGPGSQAELSGRTGIHRSDLVAVINELTEQGLVERNQHPADRRRNVVTVTTRGARRLQRLDKVLAEVDAEVFAALEPADRDQLTRLLTAVVEHHAPS